MKFKDLKVGDKFMVPDSEAHFMKTANWRKVNCIVLQGDEDWDVGMFTTAFNSEEVSRIVYTGVHRMEDK